MRLASPVFWLLALTSIPFISTAKLSVAQTSSVRVATGLAAPLYGTARPGDNDRMFILQQGSSGTAAIRMLDLNTLSVSTFMTITGLATGGERGLLGMAFDPDYANNGYFYTYSSHPSVSGNHQSEVRRYTVNGNPMTATTADPASAFPIMSFFQPFSNHNGGWMGFDPTSSDPYLYIATGDGGSANDPQNNGQRIVNNRLGKMLRIDVSGDDFPGSSTANYAIPPSNPFVGQVGDDEIWAYGLRNPWRSSFDRTNGDLWIGDVGQNAREEINYQPAASMGGENYGWRVLEGTACFDNSQTGGNPPCNATVFTDPIYEYTHGGGLFQGFSVTGGYVYRGSVDQYEGLYFFGDYSNSHIWTIDPFAENPTATVLRRNTELVPNLGSFSGIGSFAEDGLGELYVISLNNGGIHKVITSSRDAVWTGDDASSGSPGDGVNWSDANNWSRDGDANGDFQAKDTVVFGAGSSSSMVALNANRSVGAVKFLAPFTIGSGGLGELTVLSGNIHVETGVAAQIASSLRAETTAASIRKKGMGKLDVTGSVTQVAVLEGTLGGTGTINIVNVLAGGRVNPGLSSPSDEIGTLTVNNYEQRDGSILEIQIGDSGNDVLNVTGTATLKGALEISNAGYDDPTTPGSVDQFVVLLMGTQDGVFDEISYEGTSLPVQGGHVHVGVGLYRGIANSPNSIATYNYRALLGDANGDGVVDGLDFLIWNENKFESGTDWESADFNGDGITDGLDFFLWNENKFTSVSLPGSPVPEPMGVAWLGLGWLCYIGARHRRGC